MKPHLLLLLVVLLFTTGCPKYRPTVDFKSVETFRGKLNAHLKYQQKLYQCYRDGMDYTDGDPPVCSGSVTDGPERAKAVRDELIADALSYIDDAYGDFKNDLAAGRDRTNFIADLVELGTSAAVGITNGERPLQILGIALTAFRGGRRSADANFYKDHSTPILISKMNGNRASVRAAILENQKKGIEGYPIGFAISDIVEYYNAGTLFEAFTKLTEETAIQTKKAEEDLKALKKRFGVLGAPTADEIRVSRENANAVDALIDEYEEAIDLIDDADNKIQAAQDKIDAEQQKIDQESAKETPSQAIIDKANEDKGKAEQEKADAVEAKSKAETLRDDALGSMSATYDAIEGDPALGPLLDKIPELPGYSAAFKARLQASLDNLKARTATVDDYARILLQVGKVVRLNLAKDPTLNERLQTILGVTKE
jgi:hypothetical protein